MAFQIQTAVKLQRIISAKAAPWPFPVPLILTVWCPFLGGRIGMKFCDVLDPSSATPCSLSSLLLSYIFRVNSLFFFVCLFSFFSSSSILNIPPDLWLSTILILTQFRVELHFPQLLEVHWTPSISRLISDNGNFFLSFSFHKNVKLYLLEIFWDCRKIPKCRHFAHKLCPSAPSPLCWYLTLQEPYTNRSWSFHTPTSITTVTGLHHCVCIHTRAHSWNGVSCGLEWMM